MPLEYKVFLSDHDFAFGKRHKVIPSVYAACCIKDDELGYNGPTYISIRIGKHDKSCATSHAEDFENLLSLEDKRKCTNRGPTSQTPRICFGRWWTQRSS